MTCCLLCVRSKSHRSRKKAKERREEEDRITARERALQDEVCPTYRSDETRDAAALGAIFECTLLILILVACPVALCTNCPMLTSWRGCVSDVFGLCFGRRAAKARGFFIASNLVWCLIVSMNGLKCLFSTWCLVGVLCTARSTPFFSFCCRSLLLPC